VVVKHPNIIILGELVKHPNTIGVGLTPTSKDIIASTQA
jgi:hypothetical protein